MVERRAIIRRVKRRLAATVRWEQRLDAFESRRLDRRLGTDTRGTATVHELTITAGDPAHGLGYVATSPRLARWWLHALPDPRGSTFVDMGSGKGRVLALAALHGYARAIGVEFALELHEVSVRNAAALAQIGHTVEPRLGDAGEFEFPDDALVVHFNNPFHAPVMERVIANLATSYERRRRPFIVVYQQMTFEPPEDQTGNLELLDHIPFLNGRTLTAPKSWLDRRMLAPFTVRIYESDEAQSRPAPCRTG